MSFFGRVMSYVFNEVLVNSLANSKTFQRFAVRSSAWMEELNAKGGEHKERLSSQASEFAKTFRDELKKGSEEIFKNSQPPRK